MQTRSALGRCLATGETMPVDIPRLRGGQRRKDGPCPFTGGHDRICWQAACGPYSEHWWCRVCNGLGFTGAWKPSLRHVSRPRYSVPDKPPIAQSLAREWQLALTKLGDLSFFTRRGISPNWIAKAQLGFRPGWNRWAIPCFHHGQLYAIQYRARACARPKYLSEPGSFSDLLYGSEWLRDAPFVVIVEAPLDALALWSHGYPAVAKFNGNSRHGGWHAEFNTLLPPERIVVADNDARLGRSGGMERPGAEIAEARARQIPNARFVTPPDPYKDIGEMYAAGRADLVSSLIGLAPKETP